MPLQIKSISTQSSNGVIVTVPTSKKPGLDDVVGTLRDFFSSQDHAVKFGKPERTREGRTRIVVTNGYPPIFAHVIITQKDTEEETENYLVCFSPDPVPGSRDKDANYRGHRDDYLRFLKRLSR